MVKRKSMKVAMLAHVDQSITGDIATKCCNPALLLVVKDTKSGVVNVSLNLDKSWTVATAQEDKTCRIVDAKRWIAQNQLDGDRGSQPVPVALHADPKDFNWNEENASPYPESLPTDVTEKMSVLFHVKRPNAPLSITGLDG